MRSLDARPGVVRLGDGRALAYAEWGPTDGWPLLHFHGVPDGRFSWGGGSVCGDRGVRLITVDRPGIGGSDPKPGRSVADWATDVEELATLLGLDRIAVSGWSAGGAYALACARELQPRIDGVALIGGTGRLDLPGFVEQMGTAAAWKLAARAPSAMTLSYATLGRLARRSPGMAQRILFSGLPAVDRMVIERPQAGPRLVSAYVEATRAGARGLTEDMQALLSPWGFDPAEIRHRVNVVHGRQDTVVPPVHAEYWIDSLEATRPVWIDAGHFLIEEHLGELLDVVGANSRRSTRHRE